MSACSRTTMSPPKLMATAGPGAGSGGPHGFRFSVGVDGYARAGGRVAGTMAASSYPVSGHLVRPRPVRKLP